MKNIKELLKKKHSKKEHDAHVNDERKLDPTSAGQKDQSMIKNGGRFGQRWYPQNSHKKGRA